MNLPQIKADGYKTVINVGLIFTPKEFDTYGDLGTFAPTGETHKLNGELLSVFGWVNIDQTQASGHTARMGFGKKESDTDKANGIHYSMTIDEKGEGKSVNGTIVYSIVAIEIKGKKYRIKDGAKMGDDTEFPRNFKEAYQSKSAKNSTLFKFLRKLIKAGYLEFSKVGKHLEEIQAPSKPSGVDVPKKPNTRKGKNDKQAANA